MQNSTFISCLSWIHKGYASRMPLQYQIPQQEMQQIKNDPMIAQKYSIQYASLAQQQQTQQMQDQQGDDLPAFGNNMPEMGQNQQYPMALEDLSDDEKEDYYIKDSDALIVAGKVEKQFASLEIYIFDQQTNNLFVHHQIMLTSFPLSIQWLKVNLGSLSDPKPTKGNYAIVSTFLPDIDIWNLDYTEAIEPEIVLGGQIVSKSKKPKKFNNSQKKFKKGSHTDAVLSISLNHANFGVLASGSADNLIKIWDISKQECIFTADHHKGKVNKVEWSSKDCSVMLACSQDRTISIMDSRYPEDKIVHTVTENQQLESATWNTNNQTQIGYVTNEGNLYFIDVRMQNKILKKQKAHSSTANDIKIGSRNLCYTCSDDQNVRIWDINDLSKPICSKNPKCGKLFCLDLLEDTDGPIISAGNQKGQLFVWDVTQNKEAEQHWNNFKI